ncbi:hypothetical protein I7I53_01983 [Histoplasma capsulatum var. duboisii H88]|uniref:Uncharacterized protein n=1 Tax=Ajellomyces capsulatus (strain H88) TaxID=544711 RepID=A0A8A1LKA2_AJEC8|nr:hypothetical protein I7I53_01983 [Histoplasma capsulatum var. duboisii H88]
MVFCFFYSSHQFIRTCSHLLNGMELETYCASINTKIQIGFTGHSWKYPPPPFFCYNAYIISK